MKGYLVDTGKMVASPVHWETRDWLKLGLVLGVTSSLFLVDQKVKDFAQSHQSPVASKFALVGNDLGDPFYTLPPIGAFYLYGYLADDSKARRASLLAIESFAISGVMTSGLKMLADRHRPNSGDVSTTWDGPSFSMKNLSFSSGHTASAFSIATVFADVYKDNAYVPTIAYGLATLTGLSRVYSNAHWSSDVFFGAALGYFTSKALLSYHKEEKNKTANRLTILPDISKEMTGLTLKYDF
ncbi:MAG TPA: phosphatase PAP2 family protein [Geomonas sp.]